MRNSLTEQQTGFFTKNGYIELEGIPFDAKKIFGKPHSFETGRDLWRNEPALIELFNKLSHLAFALTSKNQLRIAFDQFIPATHRLPKSPLKELFCIQGIAVAFLITEAPIHIERRSDLGILPIPTTAQNIYFFLPHLIIDWPSLPPSTNLYLGAFAIPNAVYIQNPKDPCTNQLKHLHYSIGDVLKNKHHPLLIQK
jgi:hypothetical protein